MGRIKVGANPHILEGLRQSRPSIDLKQQPARLTDENGALQGVLEELGLEHLHRHISEAAGGDSLSHLKTFAFSLAEKESIRSMGVPKIRARKLWRRVEVMTTGSSLM